MSIVCAGLSKRFISANRTVAALEDVSLTFDSGSATAIVGSNGAGKSTLLRVIAGILTPSAGTVRRPASCASLIQLGAGFHDDLSISENMDLALALAGFEPSQRHKTRALMLEFSGLTELVNRPLKSLSTGMVARLAASIAVHSNADALLVDEVLAVGDREFRARLLDRVALLVSEGVTLVLVTHDLGLAGLAAPRTVWIEHGRVRSDGPSTEVLPAYADHLLGRQRNSDITGVALRDLQLSDPRIDPLGALTATTIVSCRRPTSGLAIRLEIRPAVGEGAPWMRSPDENPLARRLNLVAASPLLQLPLLVEGDQTVVISLPEVPISASMVEVSVAIVDEHHRLVDDAVAELAIGDRPMRPHFHLTGRLVPGSQE